MTMLLYPPVQPVYAQPPQNAYQPYGYGQAPVQQFYPSAPESASSVPPQQPAYQQPLQSPSVLSEPENTPLVPGVPEAPTGQSLPLRNRKRIPKISRKNKCGIFPVFTPERSLQVYLSRQGPFMLWRVRQKKTGWRCQPVLVFFVNKAQTMVRTRIIASRFSNAETASAVTSPETSRMV